MKRSEFIRYLQKHHCILHREGSNHTIIVNLRSKKQSTLGRHQEISNLLCKKICKQLGIPEI